MTGRRIAHGIPRDDGRRIAMKIPGLAKSIALIALLCAFTGAAWAQPYPAKPIRWVVPSSPGGGADTTTRLLANALPPMLGQRVIVDNRAGASGNIGSDIAAKAPAHGYTWLMINNSQAA